MALGHFNYICKAGEMPNTVTMCRIKTIKYEEAQGRLKEIYDQLLKKRGKLADVHCIQSLRPESIVKHMELYMEIMFSHSDLSRAEREMMAVVVSAHNQCHYCQVHHAEALVHFWKDENKVSLLKKDFEKTLLSEREMALCRFSKALTLNPGISKEKDITQGLRKAGIGDNGILDATLVTAYFNFVNRIVLALDVGLEKDQGKGYVYDTTNNQ